MAKQTLVFESPLELSLKEGMIVITDRNTDKSTLRSMEDIQLVIIDHYSVRISVPLITEFSKYNIAVVFCDRKTHASHCLNRKHSNSLAYGKYDNVEFF
jgi:CRISPR/Cas system-associated endonuclease Cas1